MVMSCAEQTFQSSFPFATINALTNAHTFFHSLLHSHTPCQNAKKITHTYYNTHTHADLSKPIYINFTKPKYITFSVQMLSQNLMLKQDSQHKNA